MRIIVTHRSPDIDAIASVWLVARFLQNWQEAKIEFVPAGSKLPGEYTEAGDYIEKIGDDEVITVDTGLGRLDHHQTQDNNVCGASLTHEYVKSTPGNGITTNEIKQQAIQKIVDFVIDDDHFQEVYYDKKVLDMFEFSFARLVDGYKLAHPQDSIGCMTFGMECLDVLLQHLENKLWAEKELNDKKIEFDTKYGPAIAVETINDTTLEVAQDHGYVIVIRKDAHHGYIRIKARPNRRIKNNEQITNNESEITPPGIDLTPAYERLKKLDPKASWYLHVSRKMLLNGSSKNPNMHSTTLTLPDVIEVIKGI